jgi:two-component system nitrate/nitrite response regulator NarL
MKPITPQEKSILELIGQGLSTRKIAQVLKISFHTVQSHRRSLLNKFDAANSAELIRKTIEANNRETFDDNLLNPEL